MSERQLKHWFANGNHYSGDLLGTVTVTVEPVEGEDIGPNSSFMHFLSDHMRETVVDTLEDNTSGVPIGVFTGSRLVPMNIVADTKEDAFILYVKGIAERNEIEYSE